MRGHRRGDTDGRADRRGALASRRPAVLRYVCRRGGRHRLGRLASRPPRARRSRRHHGGSSGAPVGVVRQRHEPALAALFGERLELCADAGLVGVAVLATNGTKGVCERLAAPEPQLRRDRHGELAEADAVDRAEDERFGERRGDELPPELSTARGRRGSLRDARRRLVKRRAAEATPVPQSHPARLREGKRRLEEDQQAHCGTNEAYESAHGLEMQGSEGPQGRTKDLQISLFCCSEFWL
jgi:hypothetical protein